MAMASSRSRKLLSVGNSLYRGRTLRILISPTPATFSERRSVLQVLEQHGPIEVFRMTPGYRSNYISVTKTPEAANSLLNASPLAYSIETGQQSPSFLLADLQKAHTPKPKSVSGPIMENADSEATQEKKNFVLEIWPVDDYNHTNTFDQSALHGSWPASFTEDETFISKTLKQSLPDNITAAGLSRWEKDVEVREDRPAKKERLRLKTWIPSKILSAVRAETERARSED